MNKGVLLIHDCNDTKSYWKRYMYNPKMIGKHFENMPINQCMPVNDKTLPYTKVREKSHTTMYITINKTAPPR